MTGAERGRAVDATYHYPATLYKAEDEQGNPFGEAGWAKQTPSAETARRTFQDGSDKIEKSTAAAPFFNFSLILLFLCFYFPPSSSSPPFSSAVSSPSPSSSQRQKTAEGGSATVRKHSSCSGIHSPSGRLLLLLHRRKRDGRYTGTAGHGMATPRRRCHHRRERSTPNNTGCFKLAKRRRGLLSTPPPTFSQKASKKTRISKKECL